jgi:Glycosyltransferase GT-D fold
MALEYPPVAGEFETVAKICKGRSIARFGDGEVKMMEKHVYTRELVPVPALAREMKAIAQRPHRDCLIGIPTMDPAGDKYANWLRHKARFSKHFNSSTRIKYVSAFITRPDCGTAWLETREYYEHVIRIWCKKRLIAVVSEPDSKLLEYVRLTHPTPPFHVTCPMYGAFAEAGRIERQVLALMPDIALLSCGPTATVLAHRLCTQGLQAIDLGSIGGFLLRWHARRPPPASEGEYAKERESVPWT